VSEVSEYDFGRDNAAIVDAHAAGKHNPTSPWVVYRNGKLEREFGSLGAAAEWSHGQGIYGQCTIRDVYAEPPSLGPMFGAGWDAGYARGLEDAAKVAEAEVRNPGGGAALHRGYWQGGAEKIWRGIRALLPPQQEREG
jgi:hypothetical protein